MQNVFLDIKLHCSWKKIAYLLCIIYDLKFTDIFSKIQTLQILEFYVKLSPT
jgi:hypothetical protein